MSSKKVLIIIRHAKSSWDYENISDIDRPLKLRGIRNAYEMARRCKIKKMIPDKILTSPANRAFHTATIFMRVCEVNSFRLKVEPEIYGASPEALAEIVMKQEDSCKCLTLVGHNPDITGLVNLFVQEHVYDMPTCAVVTLEFKAEKWKDIDRNSLISENFDYPKKEY